MASGTTISPASAAMAPRQPNQRSPSISARLTTFGPGSTWLAESNSTNSARVKPAAPLDQLHLRDGEHAAETLAAREAVEGEEGSVFEAWRARRVVVHAANLERAAAHALSAIARGHPQHAHRAQPVKPLAASSTPPLAAPMAWPR